MTTVTITYKAFTHLANNRVTTSLSFILPSEYEQHATQLTNEKLCDVLYDTTNVQSNNSKLWQVIEPLLPVNRTHTSLSVGDEVTINDNTYKCADFGWEYLGEKVGA
jgi:hypothetical protein